MPEEEGLIDEQDLQGQPEAEPEQEYEAQEGYEEPEQEAQPEPEDWRVQAIRNDPSVRERFDRALFGGQQEPQQPQADPEQQAREHLQQVESDMPQLDENNMSAERVQQFLNWQEQRRKAEQAVNDARFEKQQAALMSQQSRTQLEDYIQQAKTQDRNFKDYETEFRKYIREQNIDPRLLANRQVVDMIRKAIGYDHLQTAKKKAKAPGAPAADEAYAEQGRNARARRQQQQQENLREATELDHQLAAFYRIPVNDLIRDEAAFAEDAKEAVLSNGVNFSPDSKLRKAGPEYQKFLRGDGS